ncbi:MAG: hypothetical protein ACLUEF_02285 [Faecalibacterium prausnitzii]
MPVEKTRNIFLHGETQHALPYVSKRKRSDASFPCRENPKAAPLYSSKLEACRQQDYDQKQVAAIRIKKESILNFQVQQDTICLQNPLTIILQVYVCLMYAKMGKTMKKLLGPLFMFLQKNNIFP